MIQNFHKSAWHSFFCSPLFQFSSEIGDDDTDDTDDDDWHLRRKIFQSQLRFEKNCDPRENKKSAFASFGFSRQNGQSENHQRVLLHHVSLHRRQPLQQQQQQQSHHQQQRRRRRHRRPREQPREKLAGLETGEVRLESDQRIRRIENLLSPVERIRRKPHPVDSFVHLFIFQSGRYP